MLSQMNGRLHKHIIERNFLGRVPMVKFSYDLTNSAVTHVNDLLGRADYGKNFTPSDPTKFAPPTQVLTKPTKPLFKAQWRKKAVTLYNEAMAASTGQERVDNQYKVPIFECPDDMNLCTLGLDYAFFMNRVLFDLKRSRGEHRGHVQIADPLPPAEWIAPAPFPVPANQDALPSTEERIESMRFFIVENKKKRQRLSRESRKTTDLHLIAIADELEGARERIDSGYDAEDLTHEDNHGDSCDDD